MTPCSRCIAQRSCARHDPPHENLILLRRDVMESGAIEETYKCHACASVWEHSKVPETPPPFWSIVPPIADDSSELT